MIYDYSFYTLYFVTHITYKYFLGSLNNQIENLLKRKKYIVTSFVAFKSIYNSSERRRVVSCGQRFKRMVALNAL